MIKMSQGLYSGFVISTIGQNAGKRIPMAFHIAQGNVAAGTARWEIDESPIPQAVAKKIEEREAKEAALRARSNPASEVLSAGGSVSDAMWAAADGIVVCSVGDESTRAICLVRPFPSVAKVDDLIIGDDPSGIFSETEDGFTLTLANATARYTKIEDGLYSIAEWTAPGVEIPADWRDLHHLKIIAMAKTIRGAAAPASMTKDEAIAIIEEWTKDDSIREDRPADGFETGKPSEGSEGREAGNSLDPGGAEARARAAEKAAEFINEDDGA